MEQASVSNDARERLFAARLARLRHVMRASGSPVLVIVDPVNIQYATGVRNMTVFAMRSTSRYLLLFAEGPAILFEYPGCEHLAAGLSTIDDVRPAIGVSHVAAGPALPEAARRFAAEIASLGRQHNGAPGPIAVDRLHLAALDALRKEGFVLTDAEVVLDEARRLKLPEELLAIREAVRRVERATAELAAAIAPGVRETVIWSHFHRDLIAREGEYVSTRLLAGGPRTFPYFCECGPRPLQAGELLCFDTDALGYLGYAVDFSRTFLCGERRASARQRELYRLAFDQLQRNIDLFRAGRSYRDIAERAWPIPEHYRPTSYYCLARGLGMSGEYPNVPHFRSGAPYPIPGAVEPGMIICVESYIGCPAAGQGVKLEEQLLITEGGPERLSEYPFEDRLLRREI